MKVLKQHRCHGGTLKFCQHDSVQTRTPMAFSTFVPEGPNKGCLIWLSGLTCTDENFMAKAGSFPDLAKAGLIVVCPDTSPRGLNLPHEHDAWDFGSGASFYVDATTPGYRDHYRMMSYLIEELYPSVHAEFGSQLPISIFGHSMGGHGALVLGLCHPELFRSVSAFAPVVNPSQCAWGKRALTGYLGAQQDQWAKYDACALVASGAKHPSEILIDQGTLDPFLKEQLLTENFRHACEKSGPQKLKLRYQEGYDHSYYFISTFIGDHIQFHADRLSRGA